MKFKIKTLCTNLGSPATRRLFESRDLIESRLTLIELFSYESFRNEMSFLSSKQKFEFVK